jgi:protein O-mannosyl-transferase
MILLREKWREFLFGTLISAIAFLVYANSLGNGFVTDDPSVILHNPVLQGNPLQLFSTIDTISDTQLLPFYRPITYLTFYVEGKLHGFNPFLMHLANILLHAANAFLVYRLARLLFADQGPALLVGLLFAVHPIHSESVNFLSGGRNTMLACFFVLLAYLAHNKSIVQGGITASLLGALFFLAGLLSKETAMMVLPAIFMRELISLRENGLSQRLQPVIRLAPYAAAATCYLILRWLTLSRLGIQTSIIPGFGMQKLQELYIIPSLTERLLYNIYIIPKYLLTIVWPVSLSPRYAVPEDFHLIALPLMVGWGCILGVIVWLLRRASSRATLFGLFWFLAFWIPVSGIFPMSSIQMADRYLYLPAIGLWIIIADQAVRLRIHGKTILRYAALATVLILVVMAALTIQRNLEWRSDITLFSRLVEQYPENPNGYYHLGIAYIKRKGPNDLQVAEKNLEMVLALDPSTQSVQTPLGLVRLERGDFEGALYYYSEALGNFPLDREARINRGITYEKLGRYQEALADYRFYLTIPTYNHIPGSQELAETRIRELSRY